MSSKTFGELPGLILIENFLTKDEETNLIKLIDEHPWDNTMKRRVQHYGYKYNYTSRSAAEKVESLPEYTHKLLDDFKQRNLMSEPNQCIINEYIPGQGISAHIDSKIFSDRIISISLLSDIIMVFANKGTSIKLFLPRRSLLLLSGDSRYKWTHEIKAIKFDEINSKKMARKRRVSLTFRHLIINKT